ncbi:beta-propeller domain-containing protein [Haloechinothrix halophila]|uniref:beta-propeller domain-containing protein n=1 Tax=Haloechinothrix halophila TaxID=1069073 RepID=UPI00040A831A|nr:beta-propeller domain-containing protein [Haloechinothrix halophila]
MRRRTSAGAAVLILLGALLVSSASPALVDRADGDPPGAPPPVVTADDIALVAFDSCDDALAEFRRAALDKVGPYGLPGLGTPPIAVADGMAMSRGQTARESVAAAPRQGPGHSSTNSYEADADEPDLVKTDGRRIVTLVDRTLRVVDATTEQVTGSVRIPGGHANDLLLHGDRALVFTQTGGFGPRPRSHSAPADGPTGVTLVLVDLNAARLVGSLTVDGSYLDARQTGSRARVVVRSAPRLDFEYPRGRDGAKRSLRENREIIRRSSLADWLPRFELHRDDTTRSGRLVDCAAINHPAAGAGTNLLTVLTIDLAGDLDTGDSVSVTADGGTVYGTGGSLYIADDRVPVDAWPMARTVPAEREQRTMIHQFDTSGDGAPTYVASGAVKGTLLNQYALSEHEGYLRVATTTGQTWRERPGSQSAVTVLARRGERLAPVGQVDGLGKGERIYAVRYLGDTAYVVTFRETDPLYALDLSDPRRPRTTGELKITGYSAYLHPVGENRLLGVGQEATERGRTTGTQLSLFDTGDPAAPSRLARHHVKNSHTEVEHDPHAFLHWPDTGHVVLPVTSWPRPAERDGRPAERPRNHALVLRVEDDRLVEAGAISHPDGKRWRAEIRRSLVIGDTLWTVSAAGVMASDLDTLEQRAWVPFS